MRHEPWLKVNKYDREYQIWKREPLSIELISEDLFKQNPMAIGLEYIHYNPVKAGLCQVPEDYYFSSSKFYEDGIDLPIAIGIGMLKHYSGN